MRQFLIYLSRNLVFTVFLVFSLVSCRTYYEKVTPEYPSDVYKFICQELDHQLLHEISGTYKKDHSFILNLSIDNNRIVDVSVLSKLYDEEIIVSIEETLMSKSVSFTIIKGDRDKIYISGLIKFKKLSKLCK
jgi:hypothetical protein